MMILEQISLCQRMVGSIKSDVEAGKTGIALGKIELLEGELGIFRQDYENAETEVSGSNEAETPAVQEAEFNEVKETPADNV